MQQFCRLETIKKKKNLAFKWVSIAAFILEMWPWLGDLSIFCISKKSKCVLFPNQIGPDWCCASGYSSHPQCCVGPVGQAGQAGKVGHSGALWDNATHAEE